MPKSANSSHRKLLRGRDQLFDLARMQGRIDRLFDNWMTPVQTRDEMIPLMPAYDLVDLGKEYLLRMDLPGVAKSEIQIELSDESVNISGERRGESDAGSVPEQSYLERYQGSFNRLIQFPGSVDSQGAHASFRDGVLELRLPKLHQSRARRLEISDDAALTEKPSDESSLVPEPLERQNKGNAA